MRHRARPLRDRVPADRRTARHVADAGNRRHRTGARRRSRSGSRSSPLPSSAAGCSSTRAFVHSARRVEAVGRAGQRVRRPHRDRDIGARDREAARDFVAHRIDGRHRRHKPARDQRHQHDFHARVHSPTERSRVDHDRRAELAQRVDLDAHRKSAAHPRCRQFDVEALRFVVADAVGCRRAADATGNIAGPGHVDRAEDRGAVVSSQSDERCRHIRLRRHDEGAHPGLLGRYQPQSWVGRSLRQDLRELDAGDRRDAARADDEAAAGHGRLRRRLERDRAAGQAGGRSEDQLGRGLGDDRCGGRPDAHGGDFGEPRAGHRHRNSPRPPRDRPRLRRRESPGSPAAAVSRQHLVAGISRARGTRRWPPRRARRRSARVVPVRAAIVAVAPLANTSEDARSRLVPFTVSVWPVTIVAGENELIASGPAIVIELRQRARDACGVDQRQRPRASRPREHRRRARSACACVIVSTSASGAPRARASRAGTRPA